MIINLKIILVGIIFIAEAISTDYGPSILHLIQPKDPPNSNLPFLSSPLEPQKLTNIYLEQYSNYATVLPFTIDRPWVWSHEIVDVLGRESLNSSVPFVVVPPPGHGMMVVIQELRIPSHNTFNRSLLVIDDDGRIMECFSKFVFQIEGKFPVQVCGKTNGYEMIRPGVLDGVGPRSFVVPEGKSITVSFTFRDEQIDKSASLSRQVPFYDSGYLLRGSIAFTAFKSCPHGPPYHNDNNNRLWPCDIPQNNREPVSACINEDLFCDTVINCGIHNYHEFGIDERFCTKRDNGENSSHPHPNSSIHHRGRPTILNPTLLEEAIHSRIIKPSPPNGNNEIMVAGTHNNLRPRPDFHGDGDYNYPTESGGSDYTHPAFVTLIILVSLICILITVLMFRLCCKKCVGRRHPYGDSSNPEALARFHENLRNRDNETSGRGNDYSISSDTLFKPRTEDLPPSYEDLFPHGIFINKAYDNSDDIPQPPNSPTSPPPPISNRTNPSSNVVIVPVQRIPATDTEYPRCTSVYTIPVQQQQIVETNREEANYRVLNSSSRYQEEIVPHRIHQRGARNNDGNGGGGLIALPTVSIINDERRNSAIIEAHNSRSDPQRKKNAQVDTNSK